MYRKYNDIKIIDGKKHREYTGVDNSLIKENFLQLKSLNKEHLVRVPLIPDITDTEENLRAISEFVGDSRVELLPYNNMAGAKYSSVGRKFTYVKPENENKDIDLKIFKNATIRTKEKNRRQ